MPDSHPRQPSLRHHHLIRCTQYIYALISTPLPIKQQPPLPSAYNQSQNRKKKELLTSNHGDRQKYETSVTSPVAWI